MVDVVYKLFTYLGVVVQLIILKNYKVLIVYLIGNQKKLRQIRPGVLERLSNARNFERCLQRLKKQLGAVLLQWLKDSGMKTMLSWFKLLSEIIAKWVIGCHIMDAHLDIFKDNTDSYSQEHGEPGYI